MNGINRKGQKVVCVVEIEFAATTGCVWPHSTQLNEVYTVRDFVEPIRGALTCMDEAFSICGCIELVEIPSPKVKGLNRELGWPILAFRPVQTRETDIDDLLKLAKPAKQTEPA